jgi:hypothetical protein
MDRNKKASQKLPYSRPTLWVHGAIEELTQAAMLGHAGGKPDTRGLMMDLMTG